MNRLLIALTVLLYLGTSGVEAECGKSDLNSRIDNALNSNSELKNLYNDYKVEHGVEHHDGETAHRLEIFRESLKEIQELKTENKVSWEVGITFMTHLTDCERSLHYGDNNSMTEEEDTKYLSQPYHQPVYIAPAWDWRDVGAVGPVHKQMPNTCWTYSAVAPLEAQLKVLKGKLMELSTQELKDCVYYGINNGYGGLGNKEDCWYWIQKSGRIGYRNDIPDSSKYLSCSWLNHGIHFNAMKGYKIDTIHKLQLKEKEELPLLETLNKLSPVSVSMQTQNAKLNTYVRGPYDWRTSGCLSGGGHAMAIVGYSPSYYFIKNSWGSSWGENGYLWWVRAPGGFNCGIYKKLFYPVVVKKDK